MGGARQVLAHAGALVQSVLGMCPGPPEWESFSDITMRMGSARILALEGALVQSVSGHVAMGVATVEFLSPWGGPVELLSPWGGPVWFLSQQAAAAAAAAALV